ncbi:hypothetical protein DRO31_03225 [Candidatus Bathyarchaeota archaeon]|nr:MAG: hypothetical protein DRO31_03225 [Candidatus Bathyarchaeota archaeon]
MGRTTKPEYVEPLLDALKILGEASEDMLLEKTYSSMRERLYPDDFSVLPNGEPRWRNQMLHMLDGLIESGKIIKKNGLLTLDEI